MLTFGRSAYDLRRLDRYLIVSSKSTLLYTLREVNKVWCRVLEESAHSRRKSSYTHVLLRS